MPEREDQRTRDDDLDDLGGLDGGLDDVGGLDDLDGSSDLEGDVGLDRDPSEQYGDLVDDGDDDGDDDGGLLGGLGGDSETATAGESGAEADDGGFLSGFFGSEDLESSEADDDGSRLGGFFSGRAFLAMLVGTVALAGVGAWLVPFVDFVGAVVGLFAATFLAGLIGSKRRYAEAGVSGAALGLAAALGDALPDVVLYNTSLSFVVATGVGLGLAVAVLGLYFGRDLRAGVTADVGGE